MRPHRMIRVLAGLTAATAVAGTLTAAGGEPGVSRVKLRAQVTVTGAVVTLGDVLVLRGADPELAARLEAAPLAARFGPAGAPLVVTHAQIVRRLEELGVNLGQVLVAGALECEVTHAPAADAPGAADEPGAPADALRAEATAVDAAGRTLADVLRAETAAEFARLGGTLDLVFERAGAELLELTSPPWEFAVSSRAAAERLGLREFRVVIRRDGRVQRTATLTAQVRLARPVVVAARPLSVGNIVRRDDVRLETRVSDEGLPEGLGRIEEVVGQQVRRLVPVGAVVTPDVLRSVPLVQRSRPVTVLSETGGVRVRVTGVALDDGAYGEAVRVRLGDARNSRQTLRGVVMGLGTVRLNAEATP